MPQNKSFKTTMSLLKQLGRPISTFTLTLSLYICKYAEFFTAIPLTGASCHNKIPGIAKYNHSQFSGLSFFKPSQMYSISKVTHLPLPVLNTGQFTFHWMLTRKWDLSWLLKNVELHVVLFLERTFCSNVEFLKTL